MCSSKEAWQRFLFVPVLPSRKLRRGADVSAFLCAPSSCGTARVVSAPGLALAHARRASRISGASESSSVDAEDRVEGVTVREAVVGMASTVAVTVSLALIGDSNIAMAMVPVAIPPSLAWDARQQVDMFLEWLFPGFDTGAFIWRVSLLQIAEYFGSLMMGAAFGAPKLCSLYLLGASWGPAIASGAVWRLFAPMTLHANAMHVFFNVLFQLRIGFDMERRYGRRNFCMMYVFCGFFGNLVSVMSDPMKLSVGASTSGFGLLGVWAAEIMLTWDRLGPNRPRVALWAVFMALSGVLMSTISPNVDFMGHFGGALAGFLVTTILADMQEDQQPPYYDKAKTSAKLAAGIIIIAGLLKAISLGPSGPLPLCGTILHPTQLLF